MLKYKEPTAADTAAVLFVTSKENQFSEKRVYQYIKFDKNIDKLVSSFRGIDGGHTFNYEDTRNIFEALDITPKFLHYGPLHVTAKYIRLGESLLSLSDIVCMFGYNDETKELLKKYTDDDFEYAINHAIRFAQLHNGTQRESCIRILKDAEILLNRKIDIPKEYLIQKKGE